MIFYHFGLLTNCVVYLGRLLDFKVTLLFFILNDVNSGIKKLPEGMGEVNQQ